MVLVTSMAAWSGRDTLDDSGAAGARRPCSVPWWFLALVGMVALSLLYRWGRTTMQPLQIVLAGAVLTTVVLVAASISFSIYTSSFGLQRPQHARRHRRGHLAVRHGVRGDPRRQAELRAAADGGRARPPGRVRSAAPGLRLDTLDARRPDQSSSRRPITPSRRRIVARSAARATLAPGARRRQPPVCNQGRSRTGVSRPARNSRNTSCW